MRVTRTAPICQRSSRSWVPDTWHDPRMSCPNRSGLHSLHTRLDIAAPLERVFAFFSRAENLQAITPPELDFRILSPKPIRVGPNAQIDYRLRLWVFAFRWPTEITRWNPPHEFVDEQISGPYAQWIHTHRFTRSGEVATVIEDEVRYRFPLFPLGELAHPVVRRQLRRIFAFREQAIRAHFDGIQAASATAPARP